MNKIAIAFFAAMALMSFGCKKKDAVKEAMGKMETYKNAMCACKAGDKACAEKVEKDMKAYTDSMKGKEPDPKSVSKADQEKLMTMMTDMAKCQQTAMGTGMADPAATPPATPPAADPAAAGGTAPAGGTPPAPAGGADPAAAGGTPPAAGGDMKKDEPAKEEPKKDMK